MGSVATGIRTPSTARAQSRSQCVARCSRRPPARLGSRNRDNCARRSRLQGVLSSDSRSGAAKRRKQERRRSVCPAEGTPTSCCRGHSLGSARSVQRLRARSEAARSADRSSIRTGIAHGLIAMMSIAAGSRSVTSEACRSSTRSSFACVRQFPMPVPSARSAAHNEPADEPRQHSARPHRLRSTRR